MGIVTIIKYLPHAKDGLYVNNPHFFLSLRCLFSVVSFFF